MKDFCSPNFLYFLISQHCKASSSSPLSPPQAPAAAPLFLSYFKQEIKSAFKFEQNETKDGVYLKSRKDAI